jgi:hypothetical protein
VAIFPSYDCDIILDVLRIFYSFAFSSFLYLSFNIAFFFSTAFFRIKLFSIISAFEGERIFGSDPRFCSDRPPRCVWYLYVFARSFGGVRTPVSRPNLPVIPRFVKSIFFASLAAFMSCIRFSACDSSVRGKPSLTATIYASSSTPASNYASVIYRVNPVTRSKISFTYLVVTNLAVLLPRTPISPRSLQNVLKLNCDRAMTFSAIISNVGLRPNVFY